MRVPTLLHCIHYPPSHPDAIHPGLLNAIFLAACHIVGGKATAFESIFLARAREYIAHSLSHADRLLHFMWANIILSLYFGRRSQFRAALSIGDTTMTFAIACGLHLPIPSSYLLPYNPRDPFDAEERWNLWGAICLMHITARTLSDEGNYFPAEVSLSDFSKTVTLTLCAIRRLRRPGGDSSVVLGK